MSGPSVCGSRYPHPRFAAELGRYGLASLCGVLLLLPGLSAAAASCDTCHSAEYDQWASSPHSSTQQDPATELRQSHVGQSPADVLAGQDCIACHSPTATTVNGGMTEAQTMAYFFTTSNGVFTANTSVTNSGVWPHVACAACHLVSQPHEFISARLAIFDSRTSQYNLMTNSSQLCGQCHGDLRFPNAGQKLYNCWLASQHANSQTNVAKGLSKYHVGQTPAEVISGTNADNCIACHSPTSVLVRGGDEALALGNFFSTSNGVFTASTVPVNAGQWPGIECIACHDPHSPGQISYFNSDLQEYQVMTNASQLCGQCHGTLRFPNTDRRLYDAWSGSKHAHTQTDVAAELSQTRAGQTPQDVIHGPNAENCIACHAPTAVLSTGGDEVKALARFFTTTNGQFSGSTVSTNASDWPSVTCTACHDPHTSNQLAYFNSGTGTYQAMTNSAQLCGQCHGNLRFPDTDHLSYNILSGTGGVGVPDQQLMGGVTCTDCHMHSSEVAGSNSKMAGGHSWAISIPEPGGQETVSCLQCHDGATPDLAYMVISGWQSDFQNLETTVVSNVTQVAAAVEASANPIAQSVLAEARQNLAYAQGDESGGFHNHPYLMALLNAANQKALSIRLLNAARQGNNIVISWIGSGTLQSATSAKGPWQDVSGAANPQVVTATAQGQQRYYRLRP